MKLAPVVVVLLLLVGLYAFRIVPAYRAQLVELRQTLEVSTKQLNADAAVFKEIDDKMVYIQGVLRKCAEVTR